MADENTQQDLHPQHFSLLRELAEVYLLLDNLSGSATKNLDADAKEAPKLSGARPNADGEPAKPDDGAPTPDWIETVCKIAWPPTGSTQDEARDIANLIRVRDFLNRQASPANGGTIAFTVLVGDGGRSKRSADDRDGTATGAADATASAGEQWGRAQLSRVGLAKLAFPGLQARALTFRRWMFYMAGALALVLFLTCALSWNTAHGNALLGQLNAAQTDVAATQAQIATASGGDLGGASQSGQLANAAGTTGGNEGFGGPRRHLFALRSQSQAPVQPKLAPPAKAGTGAAPTAPPPLVSTPKPFVRYCDQPAYLRAARGSDANGVDVFASPTQAKLCDDLERKNDAVAAASSNLKRWVNQLQWRWLLPPPGATPTGAACDAECATYADSQFASSLLGVLSGAVLPFLYGLLGAGAAVVRSLSAKLREWQLDPRDLLISFIQLALGAVLGACIGLFVTPAGAAGVASDTGSGAAASQGLLGPVHLSAAALCFIAGFFVEGVFKALEGLMNRVFGLNAPGQPAKS